MTQKTTIKEDKKLGQLKAILYLFQTSLEDFRDEVDKSYELLKIGERTDLSNVIEKTLEDPIEGLFKTSSSINEKVQRIIDLFVKSFLKKHSKIIQQAYRSKTSLNNLHYSIVLKDDNIENRNKIFDFFHEYDLLDVSSSHPVYFQFVPPELTNKIKYAEEISLT